MSKNGFTIVELLIVIVVIAILAAIAVVAYNGIQDRSHISRSISELSSVNKAIRLYYAQYGSYPNTNTTIRNSTDNPTDYVPGLVPEFVSKLPISAHGTGGNAGAYFYRSTNNGVDYKLVAHSGKYTQLCEAVRAQQAMLIDPARDCWAYGYWSAGGASL